MKDEITVEYVQKLIEAECDEIKELLLSKNKKYGNSALVPKRIFSNTNPIEQIKVRIDDKLSRISNMAKQSTPETEDACKDLIGYLVLLRVAERIYS